MKVIDISRPSPEGTQKIIDEIKEALAYFVIIFDPISDDYRLLHPGITDKQIFYIMELVKAKLILNSILEERDNDE